MKGAANVSLSMKDIATVEFPLPPIERQRELSNLFFSLQELQKELSAEYEKQTEYAKLLRQNILQEAIEGKLTAAWRNQNPVQKGNPDYDAKALFEQIQNGEVSPPLPSQVAPRIAPASSTDSLRFIGLSSTPSAGNTPATPPIKIPQNWIWVKLGNLGILSGDKRLPAGESFSTKETDHIYIRIKDMKNDSVDLSDLKYISDKLAEN